MKFTKPVITVCLMVCLLCIAQTAPAEIRPGAVTLSPSVGGYVFEGNQCLEDEVAYGLALGYNFTEHWATELGFNYVETESMRNGCDEDVYLYHIDGLYHFMPSERLVPFIAAGAGAIVFDPENAGSDEDFMLNYGVGVKYFLFENVALRGDVRHVISFDQTQSNLLYTAGLMFSFGGEKAVAEAPPYVEKKAAVIPPEPKPEPKPVVVAAPAPKKVVVIAFEDIHFDFDKSTLKPEAKMQLKKNIQILKDNPNTKVRIAGYTSASGSAEYNRKLSERRANAVKTYLIDEGIITPDRLVTIGYGEANPETYEPSPEQLRSPAAKSNMRVLFEIIAE